LEGHIVREVEPKCKRGEAERLVGLIHDFEYIKSLKDACDKCLETGKPRRLRQSYSRTLVDENSYEAAMDAVGLWLHATDRVLRGGGKVSWASDQVKVYERFTQQPTPPPHPYKAFVLVRPPSHHATRSRGMGGCLVNAIACAAIHALEINGIRSVGILDVDAHFGNGIANCIEENQRIRYVSLHEHNRGMSMGGSRPEYDPRSPEEEDNGPSGNVCNIVLKKGEGWETYEGKLMKGLAFLKDCDILIVAAGFDAVKEDNTSGLLLVPEDFRAIGHCINKTMEKKPIVFGLEGGYTHHMGVGPEGMGGVQGDCVAEFIEGLRVV
jgi:acetoin utilization deacetylase AcuC-like enzyme